MSFYDRVEKKENELSNEERSGSAFEVILSELKKIGYGISFNILNAADFGAPKNRKRLVMLGARDGKKTPLVRGIAFC